MPKHGSNAQVDQCTKQGVQMPIVRSLQCMESISSKNEVTMLRLGFNPSSAIYSAKKVVQYDSSLIFLENYIKSGWTITHIRNKCQDAVHDRSIHTLSTVPKQACGQIPR